MGNVDYSQLGEQLSLSTDKLIGIADTDGVLKRSTLQKLQAFLNTIGVSSYKGVLLAADAAVTEDGIYIAGDSGTYTNNGGLVINLSNNFALISVTDTQTTFTKVDIPLNIVFDSTPKKDSTNAVESGGIFDELEKKQSNIYGDTTEIDTSSYIQNGALNSSGVFSAIASYRAIIDYPITDGKKFLIQGIESGSKYGAWKDVSDTVISTFIVLPNTIYTAPANTVKADVTLVGGADTPGDVDSTFLLSDNDLDSDFEVSKINGLTITDVATKVKADQNTIDISTKQSKINVTAVLTDVSANVQNGGYTSSGVFVANSNLRAIVDYPVTAGQTIKILGLESGAKNGVFKTSGDLNVGSVFSVNSNDVYTVPATATKACLTLVGGADTPGDVNYSFYLGSSNEDMEVSKINGFEIRDVNLHDVEVKADTAQSELDNLTELHPFQFRKAVNSVMKNAVKNIVLIDPNPSKDYTFAVFRKNIAGSGNLWDLRIYEYDGGFGAFIQWTDTNYTPSANIEQLELTGGGNTKAYVTIDWRGVADETSLTNQIYTTAGLTRTTYFYTKQISTETPFSDKHDIIIPSKIYLPTGRQLWMYNHSIIENEAAFDTRDFNLFLDGTGVEVRKFKDYNKINAATGTVEFKVRDLRALTKTNKTLSNIFTKTINVYDKAIATPININTLVIADSYFDNQYGSGVYEYMKSLAVADGNTITFKGTRTSYGNLGEARGGWNEGLYLNEYVPTGTRVSVDSPDTTGGLMCSPFVFSTDDTVGNSYFSFSEYLSTNSITNVDNIVFFLGMNGGDGSDTNTMITNIKAALPNVNIFVCMIPTAELWRENLDSWTRQLDREARNKNYLTLFEGREVSDDLYVVPISAMFNRDFSLRIREQDSVQYPSELDIAIQPYQKEIMVDDHHPQGAGAKSIAYLIYNYLLYVNS